MIGFIVGQIDHDNKW